MKTPWAIALATVVGTATFVLGVWQGTLWMERHDPMSTYNFERRCVAYGGHIVDLGTEIQCHKHGKTVARSSP